MHPDMGVYDRRPNARLRCSFEDPWGGSFPGTMPASKVKINTGRSE